MIVWKFHADRAEAALGRRSEFLRALEEESGDYCFDRFAAELIYTELVSNVVRHASGPIDVQLSCNDGEATIAVYDRGKGFSLHPRLPRHSLDESGRGLFLVSQFSKRVKVQTFPAHGSVVSAVFPLQ